MTVAELGVRMSHVEFCNWQRFQAREPLPLERLDLVGGMICMVLANINNPRRSEPWTPGDFMPVQRKATEDEPQKDEETIALEEELALTRFVLANGGRLV